MAVGDRIKRARNLRGMTQKELGIAIGFEEKSADIRIAQYESNTRTPKEELLRKIAEVLDVNYRSLYEPTLYAAEDVMYTLFELDEHYPGTRLYEVTDTTDPDLPEKHMAVSFRYRLLDDFLKEWQLRKKQLREGEITKEEYLEWKLNWPQTADGCGRYEPKKKWRKEHISLFVLLGIIFLLSILLPILFERIEFIGLAPLVGLIEYGYQNNKMMIYVEHNLYD